MNDELMGHLLNLAITMRQAAALAELIAPYMSPEKNFESLRARIASADKEVRELAAQNIQ